MKLCYLLMVTNLYYFIVEIFVMRSSKMSLKSKNMIFFFFFDISIRVLFRL